MDTGIGAGELCGSGVGRRGLPTQSSSAYLDSSGISQRSNDAMNASRVNVLRATVQRYSDAMSKLLLSSNVLQGERSKSYASVAGSSGSEVRVSRGPTVELPNITSFLVIRKDDSADKFTSSQATKETLCRMFKPADCDLKVRRLTHACDSDVRIEAFSPDIEKIKAHPELAKAGLTICANVKSNPRLIVHGVPAEMSAEEIRDELAAQNLCTDAARNLKTVFIFTPKQNRSTTSCVLEISSAVRRELLKCGRIYLRYAPCSFSDHVVQCFKCLSFGHIAKDCRNNPSWTLCWGPRDEGLQVQRFTA
ncbi:hypothetical protein ACFW04_008637 [Cataglyphis niger]